jgi:hypothetical protein
MTKKLGAPTTERLFHRGRPLKRWRYVGVFGERLMICAASVQVGPARQTFWAVFERANTLAGAPSGEHPSEHTQRTDGEHANGADEDAHGASGHADGALVERTRLVPRRGALDLTPGRLRIRDDGVLLDLVLKEDSGIEATCPHGRAHVWTRKQAGVRAHGTLAFGSHPPDSRQPDPGTNLPRPGAHPPRAGSHSPRAPIAVDALAVIDDTAGYHARVTEWWWAAGVGYDADGIPLAFNLVQGVNDPPNGSERAVWIAGVPHEAPPVRFSADLRSISSGDGSELHFAPEAERSRRENLLLVRSDYRAPFGTFSGTLPGGIALAHGLGVIEHHRARW